MTRKYSDDRLALAQEIYEGLKLRGFWVPADYAGPDLITAVFKAIEDQKKTILECRDALANANGFFCQADTKLLFGRRWSADHEEVAGQVKDLVDKLPNVDIHGQR